jgi:outer membrane protein OmpA-like peptidoglycan-associated protein
MKKTIVCAIILSLALMGCATNTQTGGLVGAGTGAAVGAVVGQVAGRSTGATLLGAAIGAAVGGLAGTAIGHYMDKQEEAMRQALANSEAASMQREQEVLQTAQKDASKKTVDVLTVTFKSDYLFAVNSSTLLPGAYDEVDRVARVLKQYPETTIRISGHTDSTGSADYNQKLSERRAESVKNALVGLGIQPQRISTIGYGFTKPIADNKTEAGRLMNRRVELRIIPIEKAQR